MDAIDDVSSLSSLSSSSAEELVKDVDLGGTAHTGAPSTSQATGRGAVPRHRPRTACDSCHKRKVKCTHGIAATTTASAATMDLPDRAATKKRKEQARKAAQKKARKAAKKRTMSTSAQPEESSSSPAVSLASAIPHSFLSTFAASEAPIPAASTTNPLPAALLAEIDEDDDDKPGWRASLDTAWAQGQKNVCIRWVREKRQKLARAEKALARSTAADRATAEEELEEAKMELAENIEDAIQRGCVMSELQ